MYYYDYYDYYDNYKCIIIIIEKQCQLAAHTITPPITNKNMNIIYHNKQ